MEIQTTTLKTVLAAVCTQSNEFYAEPDKGWRVRTMSPDHTSLVDIFIPKSAFVSYEDGETFGVPADKLLKAVSSGDSAAISFGDGMMAVSAGRMKHKIALLGDAKDMPKMPQPPYAAKFSVSADIFKEGLFGSVVSAEAVRVTLTDKTLRVSAEDEKGSGSEMTVSEGELAQCEGEGSSMFSADVLASYMKSVPKGAVLVVSLGDDLPISVAYEAGGAAVTYLLAPRIESE